MSERKIRPLHGFLHVEDLPVGTEKVTPGGIVLLARKEPRVRYGVVRAVGPGPDKKGRRVGHEVKVGDLVIFDCYIGNQFDDATYHGASWRILSEDQLLGLVEDPPKNLDDLPVLSDKTAAK